MKKERTLSDLVSIGPAMLRDFQLLGIRSVAQLARANPERLYERLCERTGQAQDICVLDTFRAAIAQARNPKLPAAQRRWWYWSRKRRKLEKGK
jgi:nucleotidyltransferase/DNA polymerase involved in DNA repair